MLRVMSRLACVVRFDPPIQNTLCDPADELSRKIRDAENTRNRYFYNCLAPRKVGRRSRMEFVPSDCHSIRDTNKQSCRKNLPHVHEFSTV
jgi:hypothetical protein